MKMSSVIINPWTINIFCDCSTNSKFDPITNASYGAIAFNQNTVIESDYRILTDKTSNYGELKAINLGVRLANYIRRKYSFTRFNIFSDSYISAFGMRDFCKKWKAIDAGLYKATNHQLVASQNVYIDTLNIIVENDLPISIWHQKGHVNVNDKQSLQNTKELFIQDNFVQADVDDDFIRYISIGNMMVDIESRNFLKSTFDKTKQYIEPIYFIPYQYDKLVSKYSEIQKRGENLC